MNLFKKYTDYDCKVTLYEIYCMKHETTHERAVDRYGMFFAEFTCKECKGFDYFARHGVSLREEQRTETGRHKITLVKGTP
jgi:predicted metal-binding protein